MLPERRRVNLANLRLLRSALSKDRNNDRKSFPQPRHPQPIRSVLYSSESRNSSLLNRLSLLRKNRKIVHQQRSRRRGGNSRQPRRGMKQHHALKVSARNPPGKKNPQRKKSLSDPGNDLKQSDAQKKNSQSGKIRDRIEVKSQSRRSRRRRNLRRSSLEG
jgi:hypothetical protein